MDSPVKSHPESSKPRTAPSAYSHPDESLLYRHAAFGCRLTSRKHSLPDWAPEYIAADSAPEPTMPSPEFAVSAAHKPFRHCSQESNTAHPPKPDTPNSPSARKPSLARSPSRAQSPVSRSHFLCCKKSWPSPINCPVGPAPRVPELIPYPLPVSAASLDSRNKRKSYSCEPVRPMSPRTGSA